MKQTFNQIDRSDVLIIEYSEKGVGLAIEAGYALAKGIPIIVIARKGSERSSTIEGIAKDTIFYEDPSELAGYAERFLIH